MKTYTFILDFKGGTYINQIKGSNLTEALKVWIRELDIQEVKNFGEKSRQELALLLKDEIPVALQNMKNVWCVTKQIHAGFLLINIIKTDTND